MRYQPAHAAKSGSVPFMLRGPKSVRTALSAAVAGAIAFAPAVLLTSPAQAVAPADLSAPAASAVEGTNVVFNITSATAGTVYVTTADDATAADAAHRAKSTGPNADYTPITTPQAVVFTAGQTQQVTVPTTADTLYEYNETFALVVADSNGANPTTLQTFVGTITNDDTAPTIGYAASPNPANDGTDTKTTVTATLDKESGLDTVVTLNTVDGTATSPQDYTALPNNTTVTIPAGQKTITKDISIVKDEVQDLANPETFTVNGTATNVVNPAQQSVTVSISDGDTTPTVTLEGGGAGAEGTTIDFTVKLNHGSEKAITVDWDAAGKAPNAATPGTDFTYPTSRTITIPAKTTTAKISIATTKDNLAEITDEDFTVTLKNPTNANLGSDFSRTGTITNGNDAPKVTIEPTTVTEGNTGRRSQTFTAKLSAASAQTVKVDWRTSPTDVGRGFAVAGKDYVDASGQLTFAPGVTTQTFTVDIIGDTIDEGSGATPVATDGEKFDLMLGSVGTDSTVDLSPGQRRTVTITDDDATPTLVFNDKVMKEGNETTAAVLPVSLSNASDRDLSFTLADTTSLPANMGTAENGEISVNGFIIPGGDDYQLFNTAISIPAEATSGYGVLLINGDTVYETDETAYFSATADASSTPYLGTPVTKTAKLTLQNDDTAPNLEINSVTGNEGDTVKVTGTYTGQSEIPPSVAISFAGGSSNGSKAASADDFVNPGLMAVDVPAWTLSGSSVPVADLKLNTDTTAEPAETIIAKGVGLNNSATVTEGIITIAANGTTTPTDPTDPGDNNDITLMSAASFRLGAGSLRLSGVAPASANLTLWGKAVGSDDDAEWENLGTTTASTAGAYSFSPTFTTTGWWFKVSNGDVESDTIKVNLKEDPDFAVRSSSKGKVTLSVVGDPKVRGLSVRVLRANSDGSWTTVGTGILNASGTFSKTINGTSGKSYLFKATVYGDGDAGLLTNTSKSARVTVR